MGIEATHHPFSRCIYRTKCLRSWQVLLLRFLPQSQPFALPPFLPQLDWHPCCLLSVALRELPEMEIQAHGSPPADVGVLDRQVKLTCPAPTLHSPTPGAPPQRNLPSCSSFPATTLASLCLAPSPSLSLGLHRYARHIECFWSKETFSQFLSDFFLRLCEVWSFFMEGRLANRRASGWGSPAGCRICKGWGGTSWRQSPH